jgi:hypothetical protein
VSNVDNIFKPAWVHPYINMFITTNIQKQHKSNALGHISDGWLALGSKSTSEGSAIASRNGFAGIALLQESPKIAEGKKCHF